MGNEELVDLPYRAEYAKSNRSSCKGCKSKIEKDHLRLAVMVQVRRKSLLHVTAGYRLYKGHLAWEIVPCESERTLTVI